MRAQRRANDEKRKAKTRRVLKRWGHAELSPRRIGKEANRHLCPGGHVNCGCSPRYRKGDFTPQVRRAMEER